jgi:hypothetical protein
MFNRVYANLHMSSQSDIRPHDLALMFIVFAMGALYSLELPPNDPIATEYLLLSKASLVKSNFLVNNTIHCVQTLVSDQAEERWLTGQHIMAHFYL